MDIIFLLDQHERTIGHLSNDAPDGCPYYDDKWTEELDTGASTYEFYVPANHPGAADIKKEGYIIRQDFDGDLLQFQITRIEEVHENDEIFKYIFCEFAWSELNGEIVRPYDLPGTDASTAIRYALTGTRWQPGKVEYLGNADLSSDDYDTSLKMAHDIKEAFAGEIKFRVTMENNKITGRYVDLLERVGGNQGKIISFEKNLTSAKRIHDRTTVATALIGIGKGDTSGSQVTFTGEIWRKSDGKPADKPPGQDWIGDDDALQQWGINGRHITQVYEYNTTSPAVLLQKTWEELQRRKNGLLQYEAGAALLDRYGWDWERSSIGDTVLIQDHFFQPPLMVNARIISLERSFTNPLEQSAKFGDYEPAISTAGDLAAIQSTLLKRETQWSEAAQGAANIVRSETAPETTENTLWVQPATGTRPYDLIRTYDPDSGLWLVTAPLDPADIGAQGKLVESKTAPVAPKNGDLWADTNFNPTVLKIWNGSAWLKTAPTVATEIGAELAIYKQATAPAHLNGRLWIDTSSVPNKQYRSNGSAWINTTPTKPGDVGADAAGAAAAAQAAAILAAQTDAKNKADAAQAAAQEYAAAQAAAAETNAEAYADGQIDIEEQARIKQAADNLAAAKLDATQKANAAQAAAINAASLDATAKANAAQGAAEQYALAEAAAALASAESYADGKITIEEQARINAAAADLAAAKLHADNAAKAAETAAINVAKLDATQKAEDARKAAEAVAIAEAAAAQADAQAYADGIVTTEENARIQQAAETLAAAKADATSKAAAAEAAAKAASEAAIYKQAAAPAHLEGRLWLDTSTTPNVLKISKGGTWIKASPTNAAEIGAISDALATYKAKDAEYLAYLKAVETDIADADRRAEPIIANQAYYTSTVWNDVYNARINLQSRLNDIRAAITAAKTDQNYSIADETAIATARTALESALKVLSEAITRASQDAGGLLVGTITGITLQVANAGITNEGALNTDVRIWAGNSFTNRAYAAFRVTQQGYVYASNITIAGGSINIGTDATVGRNLYIGQSTDYSNKRIYFNGSSYIQHDGVTFTLQTGKYILADSYGAEIYADNGSMYISGNFMSLEAPTVYANNDFEVYGALRVQTGMSINGLYGWSSSVYITSGTGGEFFTNYRETGWMGIGAIAPNTNTTFIGVGVNFRMRKSYTPSSISLSTSSNNLPYSSNALVTDIRGDGFWFYCQSGNTQAAYKFWRGLYTA